MNNVNDKYFMHERKELIPLFADAKNLKILDVGCGYGNTGLYLKNIGIASRVVGIEVNGQVANEAENRLDRVITSDIEVLDIKQIDEKFDVIIFADVLEHMRYPWKALQNLNSLLNKNGFIIASIPNVRYWRVSASLFFGGKWNYTAEGILDIDHLRFFTKFSIKILFEQAGLKIDYWSNSSIKGKSRIFNFLTIGLLKDYFIQQYFIRAVKEE